MNLYVGTSGYSYKEWKGTFYPKDLSEKRMLHYYGERFRTVEIKKSSTILKIFLRWQFSLYKSSHLFRTAKDGHLYYYLKLKLPEESYREWRRLT